MTQLVDAAHARQHILLTGEPGIGKTCTLRSLRQRLPGEGFRLTYCNNATLGRRDFYRQLCRAVGLSPKATAAAVFDALGEHVEQLGRDSVHAVFLIDEAHLLKQDVLEHLHVMANYQRDSKPLLSIALVGLRRLGESTCQKSLSGRIAEQPRRVDWLARTRPDRQAPPLNGTLGEHSAALGDPCTHLRPHEPRLDRATR